MAEESEVDLRSLAEALYPRPSKVVHRLKNRRTMDEYLRAVDVVVPSFRQPSDRDRSLLAILSDHAEDDGRFDPVEMNLDLGAVKRARAFGYIERRGDGLFLKPTGRVASPYRTEPASESEKDELERTFQLIERRRNQGPFRRELMRAFRGRCVVTGCEVMDVLEACHIVPYSEGSPERDAIENGLLLRADIHTLYDLHLLTIIPMAVGMLGWVNLSRRLKHVPPYAEFHHKKVPFGRASPENLRKHSDRTREMWDRVEFA